MLLPTFKSFARRRKMCRANERCSSFIELSQEWYSSVSGYQCPALQLAPSARNDIKLALPDCISTQNHRLRDLQGIKPQPVHASTCYRRFFKMSLWRSVLVSQQPSQTRQYIDTCQLLQVSFAEDTRHDRRRAYAQCRRHAAIFRSDRVRTRRYSYT
jgi:hypothetical protein